MSLDFQDRLRPASYISPSGIESEFQIDTLKKKGGKKLSTQEIIDSDESVTQDQGNKTQSFPMSIYFIGSDFDNLLNDFEVGLKERYTTDTPGILKHPMWGDINVFPVSWDLTIELVKGVGVGRIEVEFVEVFPRKYPESTLNNSDLASADLDDMSFIDSAAQMITDTAAAASNIAGKIQAVVGVISSAVEFLESVEDTMTEIQNGITSMIDDVAGNISQLLFATQRLMRAPSRFRDSTLNKINTYKEMCGDIISSIKDDKETDPTNLKNNAILMQTFAGYAVGVMAESALYTDFSVRTDSIAVIDSLNEALENYNTALADSRTDSDISKEYSGDHNFLLLLLDCIARTNDILLNKSFDLKAEKRFKLKSNSDIITLCYDNYGKIDNETIEYFISTNDIKNDEFLELPAGREVVFYV
jgi:hypothetical protein